MTAFSASLISCIVPLFLCSYWSTVVYTVYISVVSMLWVLRAVLWIFFKICWIWEKCSQYSWGIRGHLDSAWWHSAEKCDEAKHQKWASQLLGSFSGFPSLAAVDADCWSCCHFSFFVHKFSVRHILEGQQQLFKNVGLKYHYWRPNWAAFAK